MFSLNKLKSIRNILVKAKYLEYTKLWGMDIHPTCNFSLSAKFDRLNPKGLHIGAYTYIALGVVILCHDTSRGLYVDTFIGEKLFHRGTKYNNARCTYREWQHCRGGQCRD